MFSDLKDRAAKAKDYGVNKVSTTRDRMKSQPSKNINWHADPKAPPPVSHVRQQKAYVPPPPPSRTSSSANHARSQSETPSSSVPRPSPAAAASPPPRINRATKPDSATPSPPISTPPPPPPPPVAPRLSTVSTFNDDRVGVGADRIDWANLSDEDKQMFFSWLDEFFSRYLNIPIPQTEPGEAARAPPPLFAPAPRAPPRGGPPRIPM